MLRAAGGRPQDAQQFASLGAAWPQLPRAVLLGELGLFKDWTPAQVVSALQKLCHDMLAQRCGATPRFFEAKDLPRGGTWQSLTDWSSALSVTCRTVEHPYNPGLMLEALLSQAQMALNSKASSF
jgi:DNA polymerase-3 subunit delta'